jgi:CelD/BcsL family acetyltransferase involved in cellulose biosynthesis
VTELRLEQVSGLDAIRLAWSQLDETSTNVFSTWEWARTWWHHFGRDRPRLLWICRTSDDVVGAVPLYLWRSRPFRIARFLGHGPADELGPICRNGFEREVLCALRGGLADVRCDVLLVDQLRGGDGWADLLGDAVLRHEAAPILRWKTGWEEFVSSRSANLREQIRRRERRLGREYRVRFRLLDDPDLLGRDLDTLFRLHRAVRPRSDFGPESFHRDFAARALERGWLRLWTLELDDRPAAAWYGFRFGGVETYYQAGRDPSLDGLSVGFVLLMQTIRAALNDGVREYRFGRGAESYKYRLATDDPGVDTIAVGWGVTGAALVRAARAARVAVGTVRRR